MTPALDLDLHTDRQVNETVLGCSLGTAGIPSFVQENTARGTCTSSCSQNLKAENLHFRFVPGTIVPIVF